MLMWVASFIRMVFIPGEERNYSVFMVTATLLNGKSPCFQVDTPNQCVKFAYEASATDMD